MSGHRAVETTASLVLTVELEVPHDHRVRLYDTTDVDDVLPMYWRPCPCNGKESDHGPDGDAAVDRVTTNDDILTDNLYADTDHSAWHHGGVELDVGRMVGDRAIDLQRTFEAGLAGPDPGATSRAVLAS